ncbi:hypothetical protein [Planktothrix sp. FACHB-1365]|uniref:hypothetical protein n=1 Tax=Planktothrix sp. FACHB-1365 TaxID=2692855 RepID=UPI001685F256|nr:hypothetical protein [Planktothrix sp. FACHB-1365]MBD2483654.1 hypothetical protein [Planktothrix sp. FACHB-1365]
MIHHLSIPAKNPRQVAEVLAKISQGKFAPFPPHPGSYFVLMLDEYGTAIEVYPFGTELTPGTGSQDVLFTHNAWGSNYSATHLALSVPITQEEIETIAAENEWRAVRCNRDNAFDVIEFWVENQFLIELLPPEFAQKYLSFMQPHQIEQFLAAATVSTP